jgi:S-adenosylmethionine decarboxylase
MIHGAGTGTIAGGVIQLGTPISKKMKDLAPDIIRRRLVVEGTLNHPFAGEGMTSYCEEITEVLDMTPVTSPMCNYDSNYGWCAYMHWKESGIHIYSWGKHSPPFFSIDIYTCKDFSKEDVIKYTKDFFGQNLIELSWKE